MGDDLDVQEIAPFSNALSLSGLPAIVFDLSPFVMLVIRQSVL